MTFFALLRCQYAIAVSEMKWRTQLKQAPIFQGWAVLAHFEEGQDSMSDLSAVPGKVASWKLSVNMSSILR
jgi:hypothetical protein